MAETTIAEIKQSAEQKMGKTLESLKNDLAKVRTGRAHTGILDHVMVDYYGNPTAIPQVANVSLVDLHFTAQRDTSTDEINQLMRAAAAGAWAGVLACNELPLVSVDFNHNPASSIFDVNHTSVSGRQAKVMSWYDNEWGFTNRMLDVALHMGSLS